MSVTKPQRKSANSLPIKQEAAQITQARAAYQVSELKARIDKFLRDYSDLHGILQEIRGRDFTLLAPEKLAKLKQALSEFKKLDQEIYASHVMQEVDKKFTLLGCELLQANEQIEKLNLKGAGYSQTRSGNTYYKDSNGMNGVVGPLTVKPRVRYAF